MSAFDWPNAPIEGIKEKNRLKREISAKTWILIVVVMVLVLKVNESSF